MLGAEFATELLVGNGRRMNKSQIYVLKVMVVGFTECSRQYWQLQMAACLAVRNKKQAITREREPFSEIAKLKTFRVQRRPVC